MFFFALTKGQILRHIFLPGVMPRLKTILSNGFEKMAYFMALVYRAVNILPNNHPYTQSANIGRFGVMQVLSEASGHIRFNKHNIDKVIVYFALLFGIFLLACQFLLLLATIMIGTAAAALPTTYQGFIKTPSPDTDLAFQLLSKVFGVPGLFGGTLTAPTTFHTAIHSLFQYYSTGILVVAAIIIAYFIFVVLAETAQTGTPFGKRFNHVWAPIRLVVAIGLLIPVSYGFNSAQWITLYAAKFGSGFASQGWVLFNSEMHAANAEYLAGLGEDNELIATPNAPDLKDLANFMMMAHACKLGYQIQTEGSFVISIDAYLVKNIDSTNHAPLTSYDDALDFYNNGSVVIRFGEHNQAYPDHAGNVYPYCGELVLNTTHIDDNGAKQINAAYFDLVNDMWTSDYSNIRSAGLYYINRAINTATTPPSIPSNDFRKNVTDAMTVEINSAIGTGVAEQAKAYKQNTTYETQGWAGAGIWYNQIAQVNGTLISAANNVPYIRALPATMEYHRYKNLQANENSSRAQFEASLSEGRGVEAEVLMDPKINEALVNIYDYWNDGEEDSSGNVILDVINALLGTKGLFDMCYNADIHPMAQISALGKGLIETAVRNVGFAIFGTAGTLIRYIGPALGAANSFLFTIASISILIGFILFYLVPFLPFLYFFFAVGGWIKGLFEAMIGLPLWALAHLRIDGQGLPGDAAINGYFLIFEIFIRPILIVFGLLAAASIFGAMIKVLNEIFYLATSNLAGYESASSASATASGCTAASGSGAERGSAEWIRGPVDEFFFTIIYAILVYMVGMSTFKLIDMIPNNILRWMGTGLNTYNDQAGETAEGLMQKVAVGGTMVSGQLQGAASQGSTAIKSFVGGLRNSASGQGQ